MEQSTQFINYRGEHTDFYTDGDGLQFPWHRLAAHPVGGARDYPAVQGLMLVFALQFIVNLLVYLLYEGGGDPRISYE